jgi:hypothetical protein
LRADFPVFTAGATQIAIRAQLTAGVLKLSYRLKKRLPHLEYSEFPAPAMPDPCIICGDIVDSHVDCEECQEAVYCSSECHATDGLHKLLCYGHHPFESRPCSDMVRGKKNLSVYKRIKLIQPLVGIFFGAEAAIPRFTWVPSSNYGATVGHIEKLLGTASRSFPIEANHIRNRIIDEPIRCFQSVPGTSRRNNNAITSIISKCKRWNGNIPRSKRCVSRMGYLPVCR